MLHARLRRTEYNDVAFASRIVAHMLNELFSVPRRKRALVEGGGLKEGGASNLPADFLCATEWCAALWSPH